MKKLQLQHAFFPLALLLTVFIAGCSSSSSSTPAATATTDTTAPTAMTITVPADGAVDVAINSKITQPFSEEMDPLTINKQTFTLKEDGATTTVDGDVTYLNKTAVFTPTENLSTGTLYTATLTTGVKDLAGNALEKDKVWTFTTGDTLDETAPTVESTNPADNAVNVILNKKVQATFSEPMDPETITSAEFTVTDNGVTVPGTVSYVGLVATFTPKSALDPYTAYSATITEEAKDMAGNPLAGAVLWSFTTVEEIPDGPLAVDLGTAENFVIMTKTGITNVPTSVITGNIGASPITAAAMDTVTCTEIKGTIYGADAGYTGTCFEGDAAANTRVANAVLDMGTAYADAAGRTTPDFTELYAGDISGQTLVPGLYKWGTNVWINSNVTLKGGPNDVWIFQIAQDLIQAAATNVLLEGGALPKNIFWQVGGGTGVAIGTSSHFEGVVLAEKGITVNTGASVNGRLLSQTAVTLKQNTVTQPAP